MYCWEKHSGPKQGFLHPIDKRPIPFQVVQADCVGPFPMSPEGFKHLLLLVDSFTKFLFLIPLKTLSGLETADALRLYLNMFGITKTLICDRGTNFTDKSVEQILSELGIQQHLIAKGTPRGNGQVGRYVGTVLNLLRTEIDEKSEWASSILKLQTTLNTTIQKSTGFSPIYLLTGVDGNIPDIKTLTESIPVNDIPRELIKDRELAYERIKKEADKAKDLFDASRRDNLTVYEGDLVFHRSGDTHLAKLDKKYEGPFEVLKELPNDRFELRSLATSRKRVVAKDMLRLWPGELSED